MVDPERDQEEETNESHQQLPETEEDVHCEMHSRNPSNANPKRRSVLQVLGGLHARGRVSTMMKKETAAKVLSLAREASAKINESIQVVQASEPSESFERYRTAAGQAMGELYFSIIEPILTQHPDLTPPGLQTDSNPASRKR